MLCINDLHLAVQRSGGTTPQSQQALKDHLRDRFRFLLDLEKDEVVCNGDMFNDFNVEPSEVVKTYGIIADWMHDNPSAKFCNVQGNHDWHASGSKMSSWHLMNHFLTSHFGDRVRVFDSGLEHVSGSVYCIPHMPNTELFNLEINKACEMDGRGCFLLLHCNVKNKFCDEKDHSLGITDEQLGNLMRAGWTCVVGHEHVGYQLRGGRVIVVGNQTSASISDCIGDPTKHAIRITDTWELIQTQDTADIYAELDWRDLGKGPFVLKNFYRIVGEASAAEAADVISAISRFRQQCCEKVFCITNAVKIAGNEAIADMAEVSLENVKAYDVIAAIMEQLDEREAEVVKGLMA